MRNKHTLRIYHTNKEGRAYFRYHNYRYYLDELLTVHDDQVFWRGSDWYFKINYNINDTIILSKEVI